MLTSHESEANGLIVRTKIQFRSHRFVTVYSYHDPMRYRLRFLWNATKGHRLAPWRSPYLLWRIETYTGVKMKQIGFVEFWEFMWRERRELWNFLRWTGEMDRWVHPKPKNS